MKKLLHYMNILFNVSTHEWPRIILSWFLKLFSHASFVMVSTILLALFVDQYGVKQLPFLYIISALFVVGGSIVFSFFIERFTKKIEMILISLLASMLLFTAPYFHEHIITFYGMIFVALSLFIAQLNIIVALFIEDLFSPLESERTFPIIESSEPIGGILAGIFLTVGVTVFHFSALDMLQYSVIVLLAMIPVLIIFLKISAKVPVLEHSTEKEIRTTNRFEKTKKGLRHIKGMPFLKGMVLIVFLQFAFINLIEFQYTSVLDANLIAEQGAHAEGHADALTHGLAFWHVMFSLLAFLAQTLSASRIHTRLGIIKSMSLHPLANIFSGLSMLLSFGFATTVAARGIFEVTTIMHRTTYHASYYALKKSIREHVKEFMEGIIRPVGIIAGTLLLLLLITFIPEVYQHTAITVAMIAIMFVMFFVLQKMKSQYTLIAKKNLDAKTSNIEKLEAIEILSQKGHEGVSTILGKHIHTKQHEHVQCSILTTLGKIQDVNAIPDILKSFESKNKNVQLAAVRALTQFKNLGEHFFTQSFAKHRVIEALEELFVTTKSKKIKSGVIQVFKNINNADIIPFLLRVLETKDKDIIADAIYVCGLFKDVNSSYYIEEYLQSNHPRIASSAVISLWNFPSYRLKTLIQTVRMLESDDINMKISGIYTLGEIRALQEIPRLRKFLDGDDHKVQAHAAIALAKMNQTDVLDKIVHMLSRPEKKEIINLVNKLIPGIPTTFQKIIRNLLLHEVSKDIHRILTQSKNTAIDELSEEALEQLKECYEVLSETKEVIKIEEELEKRKG